MQKENEIYDLLLTMHGDIQDVKAGMQRLEKRMDSLEQRMDSLEDRMDLLEQRVDEKIQALEDRIQENFVATGQQFEYMTKVMQEKNEEMEKQFNFHSLKIMQLERDFKLHLLTH